MRVTKGPATIFGLPLAHPVVLLNGMAVVLSGIHLTVILSIHLPSGMHPYYRAIIGAVMLSGLAIWCRTSSWSSPATVVTYAVTTLNLMFGLFWFLAGIAYVVGPRSFLWRLMFNA